MNLQEQSDLQAALKPWTDGPKYLLLNQVEHYPAIKIASDLNVTALIGSKQDCDSWIQHFDGSVGTIFVKDVSDDHLETLKFIRKDLDIRQV